MKKLFLIALLAVAVGCVTEIPPMEASEEWICKYGEDLNGDGKIDHNDFYLFLKGDKGDKGNKGDKGDPGKDGYTPWICDGYWWIGFCNTGIRAEGLNGKDGADGLIPYIKDGNWWIGDTNTGIKAKGEDGQDGDDGRNGADGKDAESNPFPYINVASKIITLNRLFNGPVFTVNSNYEWNYRIKDSKSFGAVWSDYFEVRNLKQEPRGSMQLYLIKFPAEQLVFELTIESKQLYQGSYPTQSITVIINPQ